MKATLFAILLAMSAWAQAPAGWTPEFSLQVRSVGDVVPSPDCRLVAYTQTRAVVETEKSEMDTQIFLADADGSHRVQLTRGEKSASSPSFSPDGRFVYFSSERSGKPNLWRIRVDGGEAEMLTDWKGEIGLYRVSPDGKWLAFAGAEPLPDEEKQKKEKHDFRVVDENPRNHGLWVMPAEPDIHGKRAARKIGNISAHIHDLDWSPDSLYIAIAHQPTPDADDWTRSDISEITVETGAVRPVAVTSAAEASPRYSPDGRYLAFMRTTSPPRWASAERIMLLHRQSGALRELPPTPDEELGALLGWNSDSSRVLFSEAKGTTRLLYTMPVDGPAQPLYQPDHGTLQAGRVNATGTAIGYAQESWNEAPEAFVLKFGANAPQRVSAPIWIFPNLLLGRQSARLGSPPMVWRLKVCLAIQ
jgi:Tol biopolymer transport system component